MRVLVTLAITLTIIFSGCSYKKPKNQWQIDAAKASGDSVDRLLKGDKRVATTSYNLAKSRAKASHNLTTLAAVELSWCASNFILSHESYSCSRYEKLMELVESHELQAYHDFLLQKIEPNKIEYLDREYRALSRALLDDDIARAKSLMDQIKKDSSYFIAAKLLKSHLSHESIENILNRASYGGYRGVVEFWLEFRDTKSDRETLEIIRGDKL